MRRSNKKGQAAMEFLMTYGWAILVVLAAIGALAYFGILSPDRWLPTKCTMTGGFSCLEHKVTADGTAATVYINVQNNLGGDIKTGWTFMFNSTDCGNYLYTGTSSMANGNTQNFSITCGGPLSENARLRGTLALTYTKSQETQSHTSTGDISSKAEI